MKLAADCCSFVGALSAVSVIVLSVVAIAHVSQDPYDYVCHESPNHPNPVYTRLYQYCPKGYSTYHCKMLCLEPNNTVFDTIYKDRTPGDKYVLAVKFPNTKQKEENVETTLPPWPNVEFVGCWSCPSLTIMAQR